MSAVPVTAKPRRVPLGTFRDIDGEPRCPECNLWLDEIEKRQRLALYRAGDANRFGMDISYERDADEAVRDYVDHYVKEHGVLEPRPLPPPVGPRLPNPGARDESGKPPPTPPPPGPRLPNPGRVHEAPRRRWFRR